MLLCYEANQLLVQNYNINDTLIVSVNNLYQVNAIRRATIGSMGVISDYARFLFDQINRFGVRNLSLYLFLDDESRNDNKIEHIYRCIDGLTQHISLDQENMDFNGIGGIFPVSDGTPKQYILEPLREAGAVLFEMNKNTQPGIYNIIRDQITLSVKAEQMIHKIRDQKAHLQLNFDQLNRSMAGFIETMVYIVEVRDPYTAGHQRRVSELAVAIAAEMGMSMEELDIIKYAGFLHDIGKIYVPSEILSKPGKLMPVEMELIKVHSEVAYNILKSIDFPWPIAEIVYQHHERLNGSGYPRKLKENAICIEARILAVADTVEAMGSHRPYRPSLGIDQALAEVVSKKREFYDETVVDACCTIFRERGFVLK